MEPVIEMEVAYYLLVPESHANRPAVIAFRAWIEAEAGGFRLSLSKLLSGSPAGSSVSRIGSQLPRIN
jgi:hypothetical protein